MRTGGYYNVSFDVRALGAPRPRRSVAALSCRRFQHANVRTIAWRRFGRQKLQQAQNARRSALHSKVACARAPADAPHGAARSPTDPFAAGTDRAPDDRARILSREEKTP